MSGLLKADVICVGHAAYDISLCLDQHPKADEKVTADNRHASGGGPAANAAHLIARLGAKAAFMGYLGNDVFGGLHLDELVAAGVDVSGVVRGEYVTPLSTILIKQSGLRSLVNHSASKPLLNLAATAIDEVECRCLLFDGHEPDLSRELMSRVSGKDCYTVLDAGSLRKGTRELAGEVDYLVCSQKFAEEFTGSTDPEKALDELGRVNEKVVITLGERGIVWKNPEGRGVLAAHAVEVVDTTGAGDAFHGAFCYGLVKNMGWLDLLEFASRQAAESCTTLGGRRL